MNAGALRQLVMLQLRRSRREAIFSALGIGLGVAALVFFIGLGAGVGRVLREKVFPADRSLIEVVPPPVALGGLFDSGGGRLDETAVARLAGLPHVVGAYRKMNVRVPAVSRYSGDFFGAQLRILLEVLAVGVEPGLLEEDGIPRADFRDAGPGQPLPAIASTRILEIYNKSFAPTRKLPQLSAAMVAGFTFPVDFNRSMVVPTGGGPVFSSPVELKGFSDRALLAGITIPLESARRLNRTAGVDADNYSAVSLRVADPGDVPKVAQEVRATGFRVDDTDRQLSENVGAAVALTSAALSLLALLICSLAAINIAHALSAQVRSRERELGVFLAVGATRKDLRRLVVGEGAVLGILGGALGLLLAWGGAAGVDLLAVQYLPPFPFKPDSYFLFSPSLMVAGWLLGILAAMGGSYLPARRAAAVDPARTLAG